MTGVRFFIAALCRIDSHTRVLEVHTYTLASARNEV